MIRNRQLFYWCLGLSALLFSSGCTSILGTSEPVSNDPNAFYKTETLTGKGLQTEHPESGAVEVQDDADPDITQEPVKSVTDKQIAQQLFTKQAQEPEAHSMVKVQRPVRLSQYPVKKTTDHGDVVINFDNASLSEVIRTFAEILKLDYILDTGIKGSVTVHTAGGLHPDQVFPVFSQILEANGLAAVEERGLYRIVALENASKLPANIHLRSDMADAAPGERIIIQIISLNHIRVNEMVKILEPFLSSVGTIVSHEDSNTMLIVDKGIVVLKALNLVHLFDIDTFSQKDHRFFHVQYTDVDETLSLLQELLTAYDKQGDKISLIPIKRLSAIIGISSDSKALSWVENMLKQIDAPGYDASTKIYIYKVQNGTAADLSSILTTVFSESDQEDGKKQQDESATALAGSRTEPDKQTINRLLKDGGTDTGTSANTNAIKTTGLPAREKTTTDTSQVKVQQSKSYALSDTGADTLKGSIKISTDENRNALIIEAYPSDYQIVKKVIEQLDIMPRQVLIEVTIADISLTDKSDMGIEWTKYLSGQGFSGQTSGSIGSSGLNFSIGLSDKWETALSFLASENRVNILSTPVILATDNKEASIDVADEIPVVSTSYTTVTDGNNVVTNTVEYRKTGIILTVTPHINDKGFVTLELNQEVSNTGDGVDAGGETYLSFRTRNINTTFTVNHQQTVMIGGLMTSTNSDDSTGLPLLYKIPGLKWIFGQDSTSFEKTELAIFITPHVIYSMEEIATITREFRQRTSKYAQGSEPESEK
ncbi:type II secretion system secretin GspD [uncultured Desulfobacter sp.]|uniref:type II secretion system secretin GspD n=1 Tax=uncultured Desulfobacter sp. TaxID=240139 RepID=UPI002AAB568C|nr:type II secretion system secretin GspD [uncultured Desulfobacter sp.]